ncbi:hypothetical protein [Oceanospirillum phage vB_OsaM_PD0307]|nr:hypothetical protein [Oceanospirillum phage vB_OsaM_PD0307]
MARLTIRIKEQITANALDKAGVVDARKALVERRAALAEAVRVESWGGAEALKAAEKQVAKINKLVETLPKGSNIKAQKLGYSERSVDVAFGGMQTSIPFNGGEGERVFGRTTYNRFLLPADHELTEEFNAIEAEQQRIDEQAATLNATVRAACDKVTTVEKLLKVWPEVAELVPANEKTPGTALAIPTDELNKLIGLGA